MKFLVLLLLAGGGYWFYNKHFGPPSPAVAAYCKFAEQMERGRYGDAKAAVSPSGGAMASLMLLEQSNTRNLNPVANSNVYGGAMKGMAVSADQLKNEIAGDISSVSCKAKSESGKDKVQALISVKVCRDPSGCSGARCTKCVSTPHNVEMINDGAEWKVFSYAVQP